MNSVSITTDNFISSVNQGASLTMLRDSMQTDQNSSLLQGLQLAETIQDTALGQNIDIYV